MFIRPQIHDAAPWSSSQTSSSASSPISLPDAPLSARASSLASLANTVLAPVPHYPRSHAPPPPHPAMLYPRGNASQLSPDLMSAVRLSQAWMVVFGIQNAFFLWNSCLAISYVFNSKVKNKVLLHLLVASQVIGLLAVITELVGSFVDSVDCTIVARIRAVCGHVSCAFLITGIMGIKAYRCLCNAPTVAVVLVLLRGAMLVLLGIDVAEEVGVRLVSGICVHGPPAEMFSTIIMLQFLESSFLCGCFMFAVWRATRTPADQARITLRVSLGDAEPSGTSNLGSGQEGRRTRRGWWDYVPESQRDPSPHGDSNASTNRAWFRALWNNICLGWQGDITPPSIAFQRKSSIPGDYPLPQPPRTSLPSHPFNTRTAADHAAECDRSHSGTSVPSTSALNRFIVHVPRMVLFRQMLRSELLYTTFLTVVFLVMAILMIVGITKQVLVGADGWVVLNWFIISTFTMHSFSRVVRRHEEEELLKHPSSWDVTHRADLAAAKVLREKRARRATSPTSVLSEWRPRWQDGIADSSENFHTHGDSSSVAPGQSSSPYLNPIPIHPSQPHSISSLCSPRTHRISLWDSGSATVLPSDSCDCSSGDEELASAQQSQPDTLSPSAPRDRPPYRCPSEVCSSIAQPDNARTPP